MKTANKNFEQNEIRFQLLAKKLDRILIHFSQNLYIVSNSSINMTRNNPDYVGLWHSMVYKDFISLLDKFKIIFFFIRAIFYFFLTFFMEMINTTKRNHYVRNLNEPKNSIVVSHLIEQKTISDDLYFGNFINEQVTRLLIPHVKISGDRQSYEVSNTYLLQSPLRKIQLFKFFSLTFKALYQLITYCLRNHFSFFELVIILSGQLQSLRLFKIITDIEDAIISLSPKNLLITFEGNPLEKAVFFICKIHKVTRYGYQFAPIIQGQYSILRRLDDHLDPDVILTSGPYMTKIFLNKSNHRKILTLGSPKYFSYDPSIANKKIVGQILLAPDGSKDCINDFINLGMLLSDTFPSHRIIIRAYPLLKDFLHKQLQSSEKIANHFKVSTDSALDDLKSSEWLVYRNSSMSIQGLLVGCRGIYFSHFLANVDPLWEFPDMHFVGSTPVDILNIIRTKNSQEFPTHFDLHSTGKQFFSKMDPSYLFSRDHSRRLF
jgi:hypothetical protein